MATVRRLTTEPPAALLAEAAEIRRAGGIIALPTESSYGLAADPWNGAAVERICMMKGRRGAMPILVLIANIEDLTALVHDVPAAARLLMDRFWPGPLTIVLPASPGLPASLTAGTGTVGIRQTAYPLLQRLLRHTGPLTGTSANHTGMEPLLTAEAVAGTFAHDVDLILDGGPAPGSPPSTVVDMSAEPRLIREGMIPTRRIAEVLKEDGRSLRT